MPVTARGPSPRPGQAQGQARAAGTDFEDKQHAPPQAAAEKGRGRSADTPTEIPASGWKDILWRTYEEFSRDRVMSVAAGVTYYALLAIFPAIAALVSIYGLFADPATIQEHLNTLSGVLPSGALDIIREQVVRIASKGGGALGFGFIFGLVLSLWSANAGMKAIFDALNIVYGEEEKRSFVKLNLLSLIFTSGALASCFSPLSESLFCRSSLTSSAWAGAGVAVVSCEMAHSPARRRARILPALPLRPEPGQS